MHSDNSFLLCKNGDLELNILVDEAQSLVSHVNQHQEMKRLTNLFKGKL